MNGFFMNGKVHCLIFVTDNLIFKQFKDKKKNLPEYVRIIKWAIEAIVATIADVSTMVGSPQCLARKGEKII